MRNTKEIINGLDAIFGDRLSRKTGWGRNEVMEEFRLAVIDALAEEVDLARP